MKSWALQQELPVECGGESADLERVVANCEDGTTPAVTVFVRVAIMDIIGGTDALKFRNETRAV